jgi:anti-sigma factor RsiW
MIQCKKIQELLQTDYLDQETDQQEERFITEHLKQCSACSQLEKKLQAQRLLFQGVKRQPVPERIWSNISDAIITERLKPQKGFISGILERLRGLIFLPRPAMVLATSLFSVIIIFAFFANVAIQKQVLLSKQNTAEGIAGYSLNSKNGYVLYDLGTSIEEYFL